MTAFPDPDEDRLLRGIAPPPLSPGFTDRVMAALPSGEPPLAPRRDRRGGWTRGRTVALSAVAAGLLSVGAAASGILGGTVQRLPVIATIAEAVTPPPPARKPVKRAAVAPKPKAETPPAVADAAPELTPREARRERVAQRIAERIELREARRKAMGLPPVDPRALRGAQARVEAMPPGERRNIAERVVALHAERRASGVERSPAEIVSERRARWRERVENLTPEEREQVRLWIERRRALRAERRMRRGQPIE